eukprot:scaffold130741_cov63-Phaeocystis_antarctica.AAC.3
MQLILIIRPAGWTATKVTKATKAAREIVFFLNGKEVGVAASSLGTEELQLAVLHGWGCASHEIRCK